MDMVSEVRAFNRFYTEVIGVLQAGLLDTDYSLTEARVLFELGTREAAEVAALRNLLDLDPGYLSRILTRFEADGLIARERSAEDGRRQIARLTDAGARAYGLLDDRSSAEVRTMLAALTPEERRKLVSHMTAIRGLLDRQEPRGHYVIRPLRPGDLGWVVHRHGVLYAQEYAWGMGFEALVARILADYVDGHDPRREAGWIAEVEGGPAGCVFCMRKDDETAQLRLLLVEPSARGMGIGGRLVEECVTFARHTGYRRIMLWTRENLTSARRIYAGAGFELTERHEGEESGQAVVDEIWSRTL
ncbi:bifunctional helix-turn-helix transcriptional regulator/GNAT family N-acetyltransferase [Planotetraspora kaengkrachanensis]|uniref:MarR family transcriptional regulator n=1 Tax=Planotetraspora kaengkrachanensis TaxID=575193 RepID=A0A8J3PPJ9_9ACTN|nr:helix-turn-helix domain-containing GNAT family N-acetyltransferase [Planotetraspora kaengkrachanensis]GIG77132.1 MarR family transcriptional regulator [Planotetraspora kaengkrachanensis]